VARGRRRNSELIEVRGLARLTRRELAELAGVNERTIARAEAGSTVRESSQHAIVTALHEAFGRLGKTARFDASSLFPETQPAAQTGRTRIEPDRSYSAQEAAEILGVHTETVAKYCREGVLKAEIRGPRRTWSIEGKHIVSLLRLWGY